MKTDTWRAACAPAIATAIEQGRAQGLSGDALRRYVGEHGYPFGERRYWPYKVWLDEVAQQLKRRRPGHVEPELPLFENEKGAPT